ncbi:phage integrase central domain-containing protein, partial [Escherichia coli]|uniref:phage integrase central domain-containing protein n=1 Tax=Escherichia coli TaxID=562 RepID=UPI003C6CC764
EAKQIYEIASRLQQRISAVMRYAVQSGIIRYNPALDMAGALTTVKRQHRPALNLSRLPELLSRIGSYKGQPVTQLAVMCVFRSIRSRIGIEVRSAIRIHSINRELNFFYRFLTR